MELDLVTIVRLGAIAVKVATSDEASALVGHARDVVEKLKRFPQLVKADGTPWTDADFAELAETADDGFVATLLRERLAQPELVRLIGEDGDGTGVR